MDTYFKVWRVQQQGNRFLAELVSSRKETWSVAVNKAKEAGKNVINKDGEEYIYVDSRWGRFNPIVKNGQAILDAGGQPKEDGSFHKPVTIKCSKDSLQYTNEPYVKKDGTKVWDNPQVTVFDFEIFGQSGNSAPAPTPEPDDDEDLPF